MKTVPFAFAAIALPCIASAQVTNPPNLIEQNILMAISAMQLDSPFQLQLSGTETVNGVTHSFESVLYWSLGNDPRTGLQTRAYVELDDFNTATKTPTLLRRYVGDGKNLWSYDLTRNTYSASFYSYQGNGPALPQNYAGSDAPRLLGQLYPQTKGATTYLVRLLQEVNPGLNPLNPYNPTINNASTYSTWAPGYAPGVPPESPPTQDPLVPGRFYVTGGDEEVILYTYPIIPNPSRSVAFQLLDPSGQGNWKLSTIYFADKSPTRFTSWTISVNDPYVSIGSNSGLYVPYTAAQLAGWRQVTTPQPFSG